VKRLRVRTSGTAQGARDWNGEHLAWRIVQRWRSRRWWQHALRLTLITLLLVLAAYVTLPWWLPTELLRARIEQDLQRQFQAPVHLQEASLSWEQGVVLRGLTVSSSDSFGGKPLLEVREIRADFSPLTWLTTGRVEWVELLHPQLHVRFDRQGQSNLLPLVRMKYTGDVRRISMRNALAQLQLEPEKPPLRLFIHDMQLVAGRVRKIGRITLSGGIDQGKSEAPVSLRANIASQPTDAQADLTFAFQDIQLDKLYLRELLSLPLTRLGGRCSGSLFLQVSRRGIVDQLNCHVSIARLDVQPNQGPALPTIADAGIRLRAKYDPLGRMIDLRRCQVRIPGLDIEATGVLSDAILAGRWQGLQRLDVRGTVFPSRLLALLRGQPVLGGYQAQGPMEVGLELQRQGHALRVSAMADGKKLLIRKDSRVVKPLDRELKGDFQARIDERTWQLQADRSYLQISSNRFEGSGEIHDLRRVSRQWTSGESGALEKMVFLLQHMQWQGGIELADPGAMRQILRPDLALLPEIELRSPLTGEFFLGGAGRSRLALHLDAPRQADLHVESWFRQPEGQGVHAMVSGRLDADSVGLEDLTAQLVLDHEPLLKISRGRVSLAPSAAPGPPVATGRYELSGLEELLACLPRLEPYSDKLFGGNRGSFQLRRHQEDLDLEIRADMSRTRIELPGLVHKPALPIGSQHVNLRIRIPRDQADPSEGTFHIDLRDRADLAGSFQWSQGDSPSIDFDLQGRFQRPGAVLEMFPPLAKLREVLEPGVDSSVDLSGSWRPSQAKLRFALRDPQARVHFGPHDTVTGGAGAQGVITWTPGPEGRNHLLLEKGSFSFAGQRLKLAAEALVSEDPRDFTQTILAAQATGQLDVSVTGGDAESRFLPASIWNALAKWQLHGQTRLAFDASLQGDRFSLQADLDAEELGFSGDIAALGPPPAGPAQAQRLWHKPGGLPCKISFKAGGARDLSQVELESLSFRSRSLAADAQGTLQAGDFSDPRSWRGDVSACVWTDDAADLVAIVPSLKTTKPEGKAWLRVHWHSEEADAQDWLADVMLRCSDLSATYKGRRVILNGQVRAGDLRFSHDGLLRGLGRLSSPGLEIRAGENHAWLMGSLGDLTRAPTGKLQVLATHVDEVDLRNWLMPAKQLRPAEARKPDATRQALREAGRLLGLARQILAESRLELDIRSHTWITFDQRVQRPYTVRGLSIEGQCEKGAIQLEYRGLLNGGIYAAAHQTDLNARNPQVDSSIRMENVLAGESMQPQLELQFPGNTVLGTFSRTETLRADLQRALAAVLDSRVRAYPTGQARTVTTDGFIVGRAAPEFLTTIFPDLNLAHYRYARMTAFADLHADGSVENDMIFDGEDYDVYMEGQTNAQGLAEYQVGLLVLGGGWTPQWHHDWKQGRLPLLNVRARIENGRLQEQQVKLPWPNETLGAVFVRNSIFYRMWINWRKQQQRNSGNPLPSGATNE
jgi:hypothetical protein